jgi:hypothetical protein
MPPAAGGQLGIAGIPMHELCGIRVKLSLSQSAAAYFRGGRGYGAFSLNPQELLVCLDILGLRRGVARRRSRQSRSGRFIGRLPCAPLR